MTYCSRWAQAAVNKGNFHETASKWYSANKFLMFMVVQKWAKFEQYSANYLAGVCYTKVSIGINYAKLLTDKHRH